MYKIYKYPNICRCDDKIKKITLVGQHGTDSKCQNGENNCVAIAKLGRRVKRSCIGRFKEKRQESLGGEVKSKTKDRQVLKTAFFSIIISQ